MNYARIILDPLRQRWHISLYSGAGHWLYRLPGSYPTEDDATARALRLGLPVLLEGGGS